MFGIPKSFYWGYIAIALFMIGDGVEQAYLSKYIVNLGFSNSQASLVFMVYGIAVSLASWLSAVLPEIWGPRRVMVIGAVWWIVFHIGFLTFGLSNENYVLMCILYGIRGVGYPLFLYGFLVWLTYVTEKTRLASAIGMFWSMYSVGIGLIGTYLPNLTIPHIGFIGTLWISIIWITTAALLSILLIRERGKMVPKGKATKETLSNVIRNLSGVYKNPNIKKIFIVRIINQISMFGLPVILPVLFIDTIHFTSSQWLQIWGAMNIALIVGGTFWGFVANQIGWKRQVMWFGCIGTGLATLFYYYLPMSSGNTFWIAVLAAVLFGIAQSAFVPIFAIFTALEPNHIGPVLSAHNLAAGLSNLIAPAIATIILPFFHEEGVIWAFAICYFAGAFIMHFIKVDQPVANKEKANSKVETNLI